MKRMISMAFLIGFLGILFAAEIVVKEELRENISDITLVRNPKKDFSGRDCALLKISTDLAPFDKIDSNQTPVEVLNRTGEVWLYLSPGERRLYFSKDGYARLIYDIPLTMESNKVYEMKLIGSGINLSKAFTVTIRVNPSDAILKVDSVTYDASKPVPLEPGTYQVELSKSGYLTENKQITVSADNVFFEFTLKAQDPVLITIRSTPSEAEVALDNVNQGKTPRQIYNFPGDYSLRISKTGFETIEEKINVKDTGENTFAYTLQKSTVVLSLTLDPSDATLLINNSEVNGKSFELAPGQYKIEVRKSGYDSMEKRIELQKGKDHAESITLVRQTGRLIFTVQPIEAKISLSDGSTWNGAKMQSLPVGDYKLSATCSGYQKFEKNFKIEKDRDSQIDFALEKEREEKVVPKTQVSAVKDMVLIPAGTFTMGRTTGSGDSNELPTHSVTLNSFYLGKYEVTQAEWKSIMGSNPSATSAGIGDNYPVNQVTWYAILKYCNLRSIAEGLTPVYTISGSTNPANWGAVPTLSTTWNAAICNWSANGYRLPTEAEWEYAARGATNTPDYLYSGSDDINAVAWYDGNSGNKSHPVGSKAPNSLGLYDMSGNVYEWCWDWYGDYVSTSQNNPRGASSGSGRVTRGGIWGSSATSCRVAFRYNGFSPNFSYFSIGFRLCRTGQ